MDHTGANVYKGMVGLYPIYDPVADTGDETQGLPPARRAHEQPRRLVRRRLRHPAGVLRLPSRRRGHDPPGHPRRDGRVPGRQEPPKHPEWWGKTFYKHFPNHGFVGDIFTVNGTANPVLEVKRRKYRFRFLDASVARIYEFKLMSSTARPEVGGVARLHGRRAAGPVPHPRRAAVHAVHADRHRRRADPVPVQA